MNFPHAIRQFLLDVAATYLKLTHTFETTLRIPKLQPTLNYLKLTKTYVFALYYSKKVHTVDFISVIINLIIAGQKSIHTLAANTTTAYALSKRNRTTTFIMAFVVTLLRIGVEIFFTITALK